MQFDALSIRNFRCMESAELLPAESVNCIIGDNASGKTSVLEAIYILGRGQSFRHSPLHQAIRRGDDSFTVRARISDGASRHRRVGAHHDKRQFSLKLDDIDNVSRFELVSAAPLQLIDPNVHRLLEQGPQHRRQFLDWGVFHVEPLFFPAWRRYRRALKQRNHALRHRYAKHDVLAWDGELVKQGELVDACRRRYLDYLTDLLPKSTHRVIGNGQLQLSYTNGWKGTEGLGVALASTLDRDLRAGFTQQGPHRADLHVAISSTKARDWVSRGQQKILTTSLLLCQAQILHLRRGIKPVLLIDDLAAELGESFRQTVAEEIIRIGGQCFLTFLDESLVPDALTSAQMFHVEHGRVRRAL
ncbi:MAG: DNA replication/repair protein RecF [Salinisphaera sp.]|jgi:DNA replication and repair protein RecF|nr:DNA replication/repair protein RecF [Salinisphaera sp.]